MCGGRRARRGEQGGILTDGTPKSLNCTGAQSTMRGGGHLEKKLRLPEMEEW